MSESSAGDRQLTQVLHYPDDGNPWPNPRSCIACGKSLTALDHTTDEVILYHNPPEPFIACMPAGTIDKEKPEIESTDCEPDSGCDDIGTSNLGCDWPTIPRESEWPY